ncbi:MAG: DUF2085 domain-containing protein [Ardenticatenaceae bacterium]|nr:DUF2085 domain-containing protein [Ardenticatenaceae bacterium]HBY95205.1 hypothetical protein [Chloroflexota bacterium]
MGSNWTSPANPHQPPLTGRTRDFVLMIQKLVYAFTRHWLFGLNAVVFLYLFGALVAPTLAAAHQNGAANVLYTAYGFTCHQLPERSYFLFAPGGGIHTYNEDLILRQGVDSDNRRAFRGDAEMGYKFAVSDRMVSMYGGTLLAGLLYALLRRLRVPVPPLPFWGLVLLALPMGIDGFTHLIDDVTGIGWRATNAWAVPIFGPQMAADFYTGTDWGSLNSLLRLVTGLLFGLGTVWFAYPLIGLGFEDIADQAERQLARAEEKSEVEAPLRPLPR